MTRQSYAGCLIQWKGHNWSNECWPFVLEKSLSDSAAKDGPFAPVMKTSSMVSVHVCKKEG